jgi:hypothetical protein
MDGGNGNGQHKGVPEWVGPLLIGCGIAVVSWALGAGSAVVSTVQRIDVTLKEVYDKIEKKEKVDETQTLDNHRQDRELQQIRSHLRLPPP